MYDIWICIHNYFHPILYIGQEPGMCVHARGVCKCSMQCLILLIKRCNSEHVLVCVRLMHNHLFPFPVPTSTAGNGTQPGRQDQRVSKVTSQVVIRAITTCLETFVTLMLHMTIKTCCFVVYPSLKLMCHIYYYCNDAVYNPHITYMY